MDFLWFACGAGLLGGVVAWIARPRWMLPAAASGGVLVGAVIAAQPTLFRAENGFWIAFIMFGVPSALVALLAGVLVGIVYREVVSQPEPTGKH